MSMSFVIRTRLVLFSLAVILYYSSRTSSMEHRTMPETYADERETFLCFSVSSSSIFIHIKSTCRWIGFNSEKTQTHKKSEKERVSVGIPKREREREGDRGGPFSCAWFLYSGSGFFSTLFYTSSSPSFILRSRDTRTRGHTDLSPSSSLPSSAEIQDSSFCCGCFYLWISLLSLGVSRPHALWPLVRSFSFLVVRKKYGT